MICPTCFGIGRITEEWPIECVCETCGGCGHLHCCEGECAQPDQDTNKIGSSCGTSS